jgi:hypothetical protein
LPAARPSAFTTTHLFEESFGRTSFGKLAISRRRHAILGHARLREGLRRFQLCRLFRGPEHIKAARPQDVRQAKGQGRFWADHDQVRLDLEGELDQPIDIVGGHIETRADRVHAGIAGRGMHHVHKRRLGHLPGQGVFAAARSDEENVHGAAPCGERRPRSSGKREVPA